MRVAWRTMLGTGLFILPFGILYWAVSTEESGTALLLAVTVALVLLGAYLVTTGRRSALPEDDPDGNPPEADELGVFPSASIWPAVLGAGATLTAFGLAYDTWLALPGLGVTVIGLGGMVAESSRTR